MWKKENIFDVKKSHFGFTVKQNLSITLDRKLPFRLLSKLSNDLVNFGIQIDFSHPSERGIQIKTFPLSISPSWTLTENFKSLLSSFFSGRILFLQSVTNNRSEGIIYLE